MSDRIGVAISTTGDEHRLGFLETCVRYWDKALPMDGSLFVTVDGDNAAVARVARAVFDYTGSVFRVGQCLDNCRPQNGRLGVAVNKNTGLELLMDNTSAKHLFLCDDDTWPLYPQSLNKHIEMAQWGILHSMVMWGSHRFEAIREETHAAWASWKWPRGVLLYQHRDAVDIVGGMDEKFGPGGHEHVEYSQRMYNALITPDKFCSPVSHSTRGSMGAGALWHAEDMPRRNEPRHVFQRRKQGQTSIQRTKEDWAKIDRVFASHEGDDGYVPFRAHQNGRASATLCLSTSSLGAEK